MHKPYERHSFGAKRVRRYLNGTQDFTLEYSKVDDFKFIGYSNSNFDGYKETRVFNSGYTMRLGSSVVSWRSHKQLVSV